MATDRSATTIWEGGLADGKGSTTFESSGLGTFDVSWAARTEPPSGQTSPEELVAAAHASCFSMAFSKALADAGSPPQRLETSATVTFVAGGSPPVSAIKLSVRGTVPDMSEDEFRQAAEAAKDGCPISQLVAGNTELTVDAELAV